MLYVPKILSLSVKFLKHTHPQYFNPLPKIIHTQSHWKIIFWKFWLFEYSDNLNILKINKIKNINKIMIILKILKIWMKKIINSHENYSQVIILSLSTSPYILYKMMGIKTRTFFIIIRLMFGIHTSK